MIRFSRLCLVLFGSFAAMLVTIRLVGAAQPDPASALFAGPDGSPCTMPCMFGIQPGETTLDETLRLIETHQVLSTMLQQPLEGVDLNHGFVLRARGIMITIRTRLRYVDDKNVVDSISIARSLGQEPVVPKADQRLVDTLADMTAGGLFLRFGQPDVMQFSSDTMGSNTTRYTIIYHMTNGLSAFARLQKDPYTKRFTMTARDPLEFLFVRAKSPGIGDYHDPWFGFISTEDYTRKLCKIQRRVLC
jgi:hypothetical protein